MIKKKRKIWDVRNVVTTLKAFVAGLVFMIVYFIISWIIGILGSKFIFLYVILAIAGLWLWGFIVNRFWGWE